MLHAYQHNPHVGAPGSGCYSHTPPELGHPVYTYLNICSIEYHAISVETCSPVLYKFHSFLCSLLPNKNADDGSNAGSRIQEMLNYKDFLCIPFLLYCPSEPSSLGSVHRFSSHCTNQRARMTEKVAVAKPPSAFSLNNMAEGIRQVSLVHSPCHCLCKEVVGTKRSCGDLSSVTGG